MGLVEVWEESREADMVYSWEELQRRVAPVARKHCIRRIFIFGSYARGEATEDSDVDILVDKEGVQAKGLQWGGIYSDFTEALGKDVDMLTSYVLDAPGTHPLNRQLVSQIRKEMRVLYADHG